MSKAIFMGTTVIDANTTIGQITGVLVRHGARQVSTDFSADGRVEAVCFSIAVPNVSQHVGFRLPCRTERLLKMLRNDKAQAERTAWRQVLRWVEAQMAMVEAGMAQTHEVFMPYSVITGGTTMFQIWEGQIQKQIAAPDQPK